VGAARCGKGVTLARARAHGGRRHRRHRARPRRPQRSSLVSASARACATRRRRRHSTGGKGRGRGRGRCRRRALTRGRAARRPARGGKRKDVDEERTLSAAARERRAHSSLRTEMCFCEGARRTEARASERWGRCAAATRTRQPRVTRARACEGNGGGNVVDRATRALAIAKSSRPQPSAAPSWGARARGRPTRKGALSLTRARVTGQRCRRRLRRPGSILDGEEVLLKMRQRGRQPECEGGTRHLVLADRGPRRREQFRLRPVLVLVSLPMRLNSCCRPLHSVVGLPVRFCRSATSPASWRLRRRWL